MKLRKFYKGQMAVIMTLVIATMLGVMALGTDVGVMYYNWVQLQKGADAAALAGANYLNGGITLTAVDPSCAGQPDDAKKAACTYAITNGLASDADSLTINEPGLNLPVGAPSPNIQVIVTRNNLPYMFGRVIGLSTYRVTARAAAMANSPASSVHGLFPLGIQCTSPCDMSKLVPGQSVPFGVKFTPVVDTGGKAPANWQWLDAGNGNSGLAKAVAGGMTGTFQIGDMISTQTGTNGNSNPVSTAWNSRMASCPSISDPCNGGNPNNIPAGDPCLVIVPAVDFNGCKGSCSAAIEGFAQVYIEPSSTSKITGNGTSNISACFVKGIVADAVAGGSGGLDLGAIEPPNLIQ
jgi:hypothetical protein